MKTGQMGGHLDLLLLSVLRAGPAHGYAVITALAEESGGRFALPEGTVYPALHRLERLGLVRSYWTDGVTRRRRVYEISAEGLAVLRERRRQWNEFSAGVRSVLGAST